MPGRLPGRVPQNPRRVPTEYPVEYPPSTRVPSRVLTAGQDGDLSASNAQKCAGATNVSYAKAIACEKGKGAYIHIYETEGGRGRDAICCSAAAPTCLVATVGAQPALRVVVFVFAAVSLHLLVCVCVFGCLFAFVCLFRRARRRRRPSQREGDRRVRYEYP